jgi:hypothetical protein
MSMMNRKMWWSTVNLVLVFLSSTVLTAAEPYFTRGSDGKAQLILIAGAPAFRGYFHGTERLLINAMLFGPGLGARQPLPW